MLPTDPKTPPTLRSVFSLMSANGSTASAFVRPGGDDRLSGLMFIFLSSRAIGRWGAVLQPLISALIEEGLLGNMPPPSLELNDETNLLMFFDELERTPGHWAWSELYDHADWMLVSLVGDEACRRVADGMTHAGMPVFLPAQKGVSA